MKRFVSEPIVAAGPGDGLSSADATPSGAFDAALTRGEPQLPASFTWRDRRLVVGAVTEMRRSMHVDRGESYLDKHWYVFVTPEGETATIYFARRAKRGQPRWWLYTIESATD